MGSLRDELTVDLQASAPEIQLGLTRAGVTGVQKAIRIRHEGHEKTFAAEISCTVDLDPAQKGLMVAIPVLAGAFLRIVNGVLVDHFGPKKTGMFAQAVVIAGLAAVIRSYFPKLTAIQVKEIILNSVVKVNHVVTIPGKGKIQFSELCKMGGIVNAFNAVKLAASY